MAIICNVRGRVSAHRGYVAQPPHGLFLRPTDRPLRVREPVANRSVALQEEALLVV
jgi:hypothetical protein